MSNFRVQVCYPIIQDENSTKAIFRRYYLQDDNGNCFESKSKNYLVARLTNEKSEYYAENGIKSFLSLEQAESYYSSL